MLTFFLGQGSLLLLEGIRQRARDRKDAALREEEAARQKAADEKRVLAALQEALELLRRVAENYITLVLHGDSDDNTRLKAAYRKAEILWSRLPSAAVRDAAKAAADACIGVAGTDDRAELRALKDDLVIHFEAESTRAHESIGMRLREL